MLGASPVSEILGVNQFTEPFKLRFQGTVDTFLKPAKVLSREKLPLHPECELLESLLPEVAGAGRCKPLKRAAAIWISVPHRERGPGALKSPPIGQVEALLPCPDDFAPRSRVLPTRSISSEIAP